MPRQLLHIEVETAARGSSGTSLWPPVVAQRRQVRILAERRSLSASTRPVSEASRLDAEQQGLASRTRRFVELEALIVLKERALRRNTWDVPEQDIRLRMLAAKRESRREGLLTESAWLAWTRRHGIAQPEPSLKSGPARPACVGRGPAERRSRVTVPDRAQIAASQAQDRALKHANRVVLAQPPCFGWALDPRLPW